MTTRSSSGDVVPFNSSDANRGRVDADTIVYDDDDPAAKAASADEVVRPTKVGRYMVLDLIGVGGMGVVCTAYDPKLDRKVAIKLLKERASDRRRNTMGRARLVREAQALAKLSHPNIVTVHDVDTHDDKLFIAMEYVEGETLSDWLEAEARPWRQILEVFGHAGQGLAAAHVAGVTHRDFKPSNVLIGRDGRVRVLDFGLAKTEGQADDSNPISIEDEDEEEAASEPQLVRADPTSEIMNVIGSSTDLKLTQAGRVVGTLAYMPPEQHLGEGVGPATDQFAFAVSIFEALYRALPFGEEGSDEAFWRMAEGDVAGAPRDSEVPAWVYRVLVRALQPKPDDRYASMDEMLVALAADPARRRRRVVYGVGAVALVGFGSFGIMQVVAPSGPGPCDGAQERLAGVWDDARRSEVQQAFVATELSYADDTSQRVSAALDAFAERWVGERTAVCEATHVHHEQSEALLDVRMGCLDERRSELRALTKVLADADAGVVEKAMSAVYGLDEVTNCATAEPTEAGALPEDPEVRAEVLAVRAQLDEAAALRDAGRYKQAKTIAAAAVELSADLPHAQTRARAQFLHAAAVLSSGEAEIAADMFGEAILAAAEARDGFLEAASWKDRIYALGVVLHRHDEALAMRIPAESAVRRIGSPAQTRKSLANALGGVLVDAGRLPEALETQERALALAQEAHGEAPHPSMATVHGNLAITLHKLGRTEDAEGHLRKALALTEQVQGPEHPRTASFARNLANVLSETNRHQEALELYNRALVISRSSLGETHRSIVLLTQAIAMMRHQLGDYDGAIADFEGALEIERDSGRGDNVVVAITLNNYGSVLIAAGRPNDAIPRFERALKIYEEKLGKEHERAGRTQRHICQAKLRLGDFKTAIEQCEQAARIFEATGAKKSLDLVRTNRFLARAYAPQGRRAEALDAARKAVQLCAGLQSPQETAASELLLAELELDAPATRDAAREKISELRERWLDKAGSELRAKLDAVEHD